jgi:Tol biopolymer transport system component
MRLPILPTTLLATLALAAPAAAAPAPRIAYESYEGVATVRPDGTRDHVVVRGADAPTWSPDHRRLAYVFKNALWTARADGTDRRRVVAAGHGVPMDPTWSPKGDRIAYVRVTEVPRPGADDGEVDEVHAVHTVRTDGTRGRMVHAGDTPAWTGSGDHIVFSQSRESGLAQGNAIGIVKPDGSAYRRLLRPDGYVSDLAVSPNGRRIAYVVGLGTPGLGVYDRATGRDRFTPVGDRTALLDVTWTPDSSRVAWLQHPIWRRAGQAPPTRLYTARPDGSQRRTQIAWDGSDRRPDSLDW